MSPAPPPLCLPPALCLSHLAEKNRRARQDSSKMCYICHAWYAGHRPAQNYDDDDDSTHGRQATMPDNVPRDKSCSKDNTNMRKTPNAMLALAHFATGQARYGNGLTCSLTTSYITKPVRSSKLDILQDACWITGKLVHLVRRQ